MREAGVGMDMRVQKEGEWLIFSLNGRLDVENYRWVEENVQQWMELGEIQLIGDMTDLSFVSSIGLRVLLTISNALTARGGRVVLFGLSETLKRIFNATGLHSLITIVDTKEQALNI